MDEKNQDVRGQQEAYARQLAHLCARVPGMTEEQRTRNAEKIEELKQRIQALPDELYDVFSQALYELTGESAPVREKTPQPQPEPPRRGRNRRREEEEEDDEDEEEEDPIVARRRHRAGVGCLITLIIILLMPFAAAGGIYLWARGEIRGARGDVVSQSVEIKKGSGLLSIGEQLEEAGIIRSAQLFRLYARTQEGADALQYGTFDLSSDMSYDKLLEILREAQDYRKTMRVTFPEGKTVVQYAQIMENAGLCTAEEFLNAANNQEYSQFAFWDKREENPNQFMRAEGYLFPDTYEFFVGDDPYNMVAKLYGEFDNKITEEMYARMDELGMTLSQVITLASLVQEEAGNEYSKTVSAVFHNRLKNEMTLGSNVAWNKEMPDDNNYLYDTMAGPYGFGTWDAIPEEMREAYDTYDHLGLPAGPVSNPGLLAIEAALWPEEDCDYFYFQTDTLGNYHFAKTNAEHEKITAELEAQGIRP